MIPLVLRRALVEVSRQNPEDSRQVGVDSREIIANSLKVFGNDYPTKDGTCVRDYIHVIDLPR